MDAENLKDVADYDYTSETPGYILYYNNDATIKFFVDEENFYEEDIHVYDNGVEIYPVEGWDEANGKYQATFVLSEEGDHIVTMEYTDKSGNKMPSYTSQKIVIDNTLPKISVEYNNKDVINTVDNREYFDDVQTAVITITEHNFRADDVKINVIAKDINDNDVLDTDDNGYVKSYAENGAKRSEWTEYTEDWRRVGDEYQCTVTYPADANYTFDVEYVDLATNADVSDVEKEFTVDTTPAYDLNVEYSTSFVEEILSSIFFYDAATTVKISAKDDVAGIEFFNIAVLNDGLNEATDIELPENLVVDANGMLKAGSKGFIGDITSKRENGMVTLSFEVPAQFRGQFVVESVTDLSHNESGEYNDDNVIVVDTVNPDVYVEFEGSLKNKIDADTDEANITRQTKGTTDANTRFVYDGDIKATITVKEANFYEDMVITVYRDGVAVTDCEISGWTQVGDTYEYVKTVTMSADGDYQIQLDYMDKSHNNMDYDAKGEYSDKFEENAGTYVSNIHTIDTARPTYNVSYTYNDYTHEIDGRYYYGNVRKAIISVTDRNFRPNEVVLTVTAKDINGEKIEEYTYSELTSWNDWTPGADGITWTANVDFKTDANYTVELAYTDIAGHSFEQDYYAEFTVDTTPAYDLNVEYSTNFIEDILSKIFFYDAATTVKISAKDDVAGIEFFNIAVLNDGLNEATDIELPENLVVDANGMLKAGSKGFIGDITSKRENGMVTLSFEVPAQFRGQFVVESVTDLSHNESGEYNDDNVIVVDTVNPDVYVEFEGSLKNKIDADTDEANITRQTKGTTDANTRFVYDGDIKATITVKEANFYEDMVITVYRDGVAVTDCEISGWTQVGDTYEYVKTVTMSADGDYQIQLDYMDKSHNNMDYDAKGEYSDKFEENAGTYVSNIHTIDKTAPEYSVTYDNNDIKNTIYGREYYGADRTATIKITDRNFRPNEVEFTVVAKDIKDDVVEEYTCSDLTSWSDWTRSADGITWTATVDFKTDANYTVDLAYTDIAGHSFEKDYNKLFTVDKVDPSDLVIEYVEPTFVER